MDLLRTQLVDLLGIDLPIIQAPVGSATCPELAAAVSNAGGLGMLALTWKDPEEARHVIRETRKRTARPFGVNFVLEWDAARHLDLFLGEGVKIISFFWGDPRRYIPVIHQAGAIVMHTVGSASEARKMAGLGVDVIVAQGWEAGGHVCGQVGTMALLPCVVDAVRPLPVVAAGGIADGRGLAAALALGAGAVWLGTRFLASEEARIHPHYRQSLLNAGENDTVYTSLFDGGWADAPHRVLQNSTFKAWKEAGCPASGSRPHEGQVVAALENGKQIPYYHDTIPLPGVRGDVEKLALYAGQSVGLVAESKPAGVIVREIADQAIRVLQDFSRTGRRGSQAGNSERV
jgi:NAD(P)H-dependent flavin oxidoreductase YrpB (nitropropane dioxygenase family)